MREYNFNQDIFDKVSTIMGLVYEINTKTDYALFLSFSGHTNQIEVNIGTDKISKFSENVAESGTIYFRDDEVEESIKRLDGVIDNLKKFLPKEKEVIKL